MAAQAQGLFSSPIARWLGGRGAEEEKLRSIVGSPGAPDPDGSVQKLLSSESARAAKLDRRVAELEEQLRRKTTEAEHHAEQRNVIHAQALALGQNALKPLRTESTPEERLQKEVVNAAHSSATAAARAHSLQVELDGARSVIEALQLQLARQPGVISPTRLPRYAGGPASASGGDRPTLASIPAGVCRPSLPCP